MPTFLLFNDQENIKKTDVFLDLTDKVTSSGMEQGLLGMAFHPNFKKNGGKQQKKLIYLVSSTTILLRR